MLQLKNVTKDYVSSSNTTHALKGITLNFRRSEFVSILGHSGCGKTTLLNIIGGLDRYSSGDVIIEGKSTKEYKDRDWDTYRNHSIGFVFQSYNLISHQSILNNVELALTISGVKKKERRERARLVLEKVGLKDSINKYPNQLSGGQMQRVAIARALVNNPEILLADEPTGALDSETSVQILDLLKEISNDRLVIMVTHNPELAKKYSTRIIKLSDGLITSDSQPYSDEECLADIERRKPENIEIVSERKKASMSFWTALSLSFRNLLSKKARTILIAFAGSIGIIGIALILAMSDGFNSYINTIQTNTLSQYPITLNQNELSIESLMISSVSGGSSSSGEVAYPEGDTLGQNDLFGSFFEGFSASEVTNDLASFKLYLESEDFEKNYSEYVNAIQYVYDVDFEIYRNSTDTVEQLYPIDFTFLEDDITSINSSLTSAMVSIMSSYSPYHEMIDNDELILSQYDVIAGNYPTSSNEMVLVVDKYNNIDDYILYALGLKNPEDLAKIINGETVEQWSGTFNDILNLSFKMPVSAAFYKQFGYNIGSLNLSTWYDASQDSSINIGSVTIPIESDPVYCQEVVNSALEVKISGILRIKDDVQTGGTLQTGIYYRSDLTKELIAATDEAPVVVEQAANPTKCVIAFYEDYPVSYGGMSITYDTVMSSLGVCDINDPSSIYIYPNSFSDKEQIVLMIDAYNNTVSEDRVIRYTDTVGTLMSGISTIVNSVTIVLIAFVSISLVVSSIMIGIITYVSVIERTKEIGVLRSLGASKNDISNVFNAETLIIGLCAGALGVIVSLILIIPINLIVGALTGVYNLAFLSWYWALALIAISIVLTLISGLIPSRIAARKDPVIALRTGE